ncbi:GNAT family N-acetyltransferase [Neglectibacter caecimuris]|uniref:GNAT family N-acetyltransferase n=1 Tax=Neglectibacter caecimuris TaxID=3093658 RepID=UPI002AC95651|nr:GNAT family protein [Neglectibacter sp. M00184]
MIELYVPEKTELWFREELLSDPVTMAYNKGYDLGFPEYHNDTGCIDFPKENWDSWYRRWVNAQPERFYAYLRRKSDGAFLGEVNLYRKGPEGWYEMGVVLHGKYRGQGYSAQGLKLLLRYGFEEMNAAGISNEFELSRKAASELHRAVGFRQIKTENGLTFWTISREDYENLHKIL